MTFISTPLPRDTFNQNGLNSFHICNRSRSVCSRRSSASASVNTRLFYRRSDWWIQHQKLSDLCASIAGRGICCSRDSSDPFRGVRSPLAGVPLISPTLYIKTNTNGSDGLFYALHLPGFTQRSSRVNPRPPVFFSACWKFKYIFRHIFSNQSSNLAKTLEATTEICRLTLMWQRCSLCADNRDGGARAWLFLGDKLLWHSVLDNEDEYKPAHVKRNKSDTCK